MITLISTPEPITSPPLLSKWLATESENIFKFLRRDFAVTDQNESVGSPSGCLVVTVTSYTGAIGSDISVHNTFNNAMYSGKVVDIDGSDVITDIPWVSTMVIDYLNDNTLRGGYYVEGRLTVNDIVQTLTVIASPDTFGFAELDVSGILRIMTTIGKIGDYSATLMAETNKSGKFTLEYRECWYGSSETYTAEGNDWYYAEVVRSEEQGSNLYEYVATTSRDALFLNAFERPIYFLGMPFDLSFILPEDPDISTSVTVEIRFYNSSNALITTVSSVIDATDLRGYINSLNVDHSIIPAGAVQMEAEIILS
jgi:hypothetical protein